MSPPRGSAPTRWSSSESQTVLRASVGDIRAARMAGSSPAIAPITIAAARPPAHAVVGTTTVQCFVVSVDGGGDRARGDACRAAEQREQDRLREELCADLPLRRAERAA